MNKLCKHEYSIENGTCPYCVIDALTARLNWMTDAYTNELIHSGKLEKVINLLSKGKEINA